MIDKLEFLLALARARNFRRAAEMCGVSQPSLSAGIRNLEETLGLMLVRRSSRFQGFTPEGERVLDWATRIVGDAHALRDEARALRKGFTGELRIASIPTALPYLPRLTTLYRLLHPEVRITILSRSSIEILDMLGTLEADVGVTYLDNETIGRLRSVPLYSESYRLLTTETGPMSQRRHVTWAEASTLSLCLLTPDMQNRRIIDRLLTPVGTAPRPCMMESDSVISLITHVAEGEWVTIVSDAIARSIATMPRLRAIPIIKPDAAFTVGLVTLDRQPNAPTVAALLVAAEGMVRQGAS